MENTAAQKILIIDDDKAIIDLLTIALNKKGFIIKGVMKGDAALEHISKEFFHVAIIDKNLPDIDGLSLIKQINEKSPDTISIMLTAEESIDSAVKAINEGAFSYLLKPVALDDLYLTIMKGLERQELKLKNTQLHNELTLAYQNMMRVNADLNKKLKNLTVLNEIVQLINIITNRKELAHNILDLIFDNMQVASGSIMLAATGGREFELTAFRGLDVNKSFYTARKFGEGISGYAALTKKPLHIKDISDYPEFFKKSAKYKKFGSFICIPFIVNEEVIGLLNLTEKNDKEPFSDEEFRFAQLIAKHAASAIYNADIYERMEAKVKARTNEIEKVNAELTEYKDKISDDLFLAQKIQENLTPFTQYSFNNAKFSAYCSYAAEIGGDYFDFIKLSDKKIGFAISDVSGKGVSAALIMVLLRNLFKSNAKESINTEELLKLINKAILNDLNSNMFISMIYAIFDASDSTLYFSRAGHECLLVYRKAKNEIEEYIGKGIALGLSPDIVNFDKGIKENKIKLLQGDAVIMFTDGITCAKNISGDIYGIDRLKSAILKYGKLSANDITEKIRIDIKKFVDDTPSEDDKTIITMKII